MKFLHAADLHLDSPMRGLMAYEEAPVEEIRLATRVALGNLVDLAIEEEVDLLLLAGDIFDGDWTHYGTGLHFVSEMSRLREASIPVVMIAGNHDAESKLTKSVHLPDNVRSLSTQEPQSVTFEELGLTVHGQGYGTPEVLEDLSAGYPEPVADMLNVGLLHTSADGRPGHAPYAPCTVDGLVAKGYNYWALGHVHTAEVLSTEPPILFPGNLQGRGIREVGAKGAKLVELGHDGSVSFAHHDLDCVRWDLIRVDVSQCAVRDEVFERVASAVRASALAAGERLLAAGIVIEGETEAHAALAAREEQLRYDAIAAAVGVAGEEVWVERVRLQTRSPRRLGGGGADAVGELINEIDRLAGSAEGRGELLEALEPLAEVLPEDLRRDFDPTNSDAVAELLTEVKDSLPARLLEGVEA